MLYVFISGMCLTREGNIVTVDKQGCRIKMYTVQGQLIRSFKCLEQACPLLSGSTYRSEPEASSKEQDKTPG